MFFIFPPLIQAGIAAGRYEIVRNAAGIALGIARDKATGHFVGHAVGLLGAGGIPIFPLVVGAQLAVSALQSYRKHQASQTLIQEGLQNIQANLGVLQTMTALTGVGVAVNLGISAVSLWQILKLREDVKQQRIEMREGFLDLKRAFKDQGVAVFQKIDEAVQDIEFRQHRQAFSQAYGKFLEATRLMKIAMSFEDLSIRNVDLANARQTLAEALADYQNSQLLPEADAVTQLRRFECAWSIEQTIAVTYQLQNQSEALSNSLKQLQDRIKQNLLKVIERCESEDELDVIFPEITRIYDQDLAVLKLWQEQVDWLRSLPLSEQQLLQSTDFTDSEVPETLSVDAPNLAIPPEQLLYETLKEKSHFQALCDTLSLPMRPVLREEYEAYIGQQAQEAGHKTLVARNLQQMSNLSVANLYWYFQFRDESEQEPTEEGVMQMQ